jgi:phytoene synthase
VRDPVLIQARATTRRVGRTFALACRLLPRDIRDDVYLLYLVFRTLDDLVDAGEPDAEARIAAVEAWCDGLPASSPESDLLETLDGRHPVPRQAMADFCAGMRHDLTENQIETEADLDLYCYQVAGTVGLVMSALLGVSDESQARPAAIALGQAMQRTNILRDIDEDAARGRVYLAQETIERFGPPRPGQREGLLRDQIARADALYERGMTGVPLLISGNFAIAAAARMYREILREIERNGYGAQAGRAVVSTPRKLLLLAGAGRRRPATPRTPELPLPRRARRLPLRLTDDRLATIHPADEQRVGQGQAEHHRQ